MSPRSSELYEFSDFCLDFGEKTLTRNGTTVPITPKVFEMLWIFVENPGHLIEKNELMEQLWPGRVVEESNLTFNIKMLRKALGDDAHRPEFIETIQSRGYRFIADVRRIDVATNGFTPGEMSGNGRSTEIGSSEFLEPATGEPRSHSNRHAIKGNVLKYAAITVALIAVAGGIYFFSSRKALESQTRTLAVLPLRPADINNRNSFHESGITDSVILRLSAIKGLTVRPLSAMRKYVDLDQDPVAVGREQEVDYILATNYLISGDRIQLTGQLFNVSTGQVDDTFKFEKDSDNSFGVQEAVARQVSDILVGRFDVAAEVIASRRGTANENAYRSYLNGANLMSRTSRTSLPVAQESVEYLEDAVRLDPQFARAYAGLARSRVEMSNLVDDPRDDCDKARMAADQALTLDPELAEARQASGLRKLRCEWDFSGAESELKRAVELDPNSDAAHSAYASYLNTTGRSDEALGQIRQAITLNPNSLSYHIQNGIILYMARRYDASFEALRHASEIGQLDLANGWLWTACMAKGDDTQAFDILVKAESEKKLRPDPAKIDQLKAIFAASGWRGIWEKQLADEESSPVYTKGRFYRLSRLSAQLGKIDDAFLYLEKAFERRDAQVLLLKYEPTFDVLRSDPRYEALVQRIGFPAS